ncbi:hypothetical protein PJI16_18485 [Nitrospira sp. MA-1]|nr:hypothetical protein [Nitrospira sp. MA-1]
MADAIKFQAAGSPTLNGPTLSFLKQCDFKTSLLGAQFSIGWFEISARFLVFESKTAILPEYFLLFISQQLKLVKLRELWFFASAALSSRIERG